mmetsp:Transcript_2010/g.5583  ORF Transcript_2010/g.5583 Transcript_2010/m.5583 type:complete len:158 (+) Transcript_2010:3-476(+)
MLEDSLAQVGMCGASVAATAQKCIMMGNQRALHSLKGDFKMPDKHVWWIRLRTLACSKDWSGLVALSREKRVPVPMSSFVDVCLRQGAPEDVTAVFVQQLPQPRERAELFAKMGMLEKAAEAAAAAKDVDMLSQLRSMAGGSMMVGNLIDGLRERLR